MDDKKLNYIWLISLVVMGIASVLLSCDELFDLDLSDSLKRVIGVMNLIALPVLILTTVRKIKG